MKKYLAILISLFFIFSCANKNKGDFTIIGKIDNAPEKTKVTLLEVTPSELIPVDSTYIRNGSFRINAFTPKKNFFMLKFDDKDYNIFLIVDSAETITLTADYNNLVTTYKVEGSEDSRLVQLLEYELAKTKRVLDSIVEQYASLKTGDTAKFKSLDSLYRKTVNDQKRYSKNFVSEHHGSLAALIALSQYYMDNHTVFDPESDTQYYFMVDTSLGRLYPDNPHVKKMHLFTQNIRMLIDRRKTQAPYVTTGSAAPDFSLKDVDGNTFNLVSMKGKPVLLAFWAGWAENTYQPLVRAYQLAKKNNAELVAVSLDVDKHLWKNAIDRLHLNGAINISDLKQWNSKPVKLFGVGKIPYFILISDSGEILYMGDNPSKAFEALK